MIISDDPLLILTAVVYCLGIAILSFFFTLIIMRMIYLPDKLRWNLIQRLAAL